MSGEILRPTFEVQTALDVDAAATRLRDSFEDARDAFETRWARGGRHAIVTVCAHRRRWWSAWMHVDVRPAVDEGAALVFARFTPAPGLWTATMLALIALLAILLFGVALGLSQVTLERHAWGWWVALGALVLGIGLVLGSRIAQRIAAPEMAELEGMVMRALSAAP